MLAMDIVFEELTRFIVRAKAACYAEGGGETISSRTGSHDLFFKDGLYAYLDSYFGASDFIGQEVVYYQEIPVWAMNYYGRILEPEKISGEQTGTIIKQSLSKLYQESRFLGGFEFVVADCTYIDTNRGDVSSFTGQEWILRDAVKVYELDYHGGLIR